MRLIFVVPFIPTRLPVIVFRADLKQTLSAQSAVLSNCFHARFKAILNRLALGKEGSSLEAPGAISLNLKESVKWKASKTLELFFWFSSYRHPKAGGKRQIFIKYACSACFDRWFPPLSLTAKALRGIFSLFPRNRPVVFRYHQKALGAAQGLLWYGLFPV